MPIAKGVFWRWKAFLDSRELRCTPVSENLAWMYSEHEMKLACPEPGAGNVIECCSTLSLKTLVQVWKITRFWLKSLSLLLLQYFLELSSGNRDRDLPFLLFKKRDEKIRHTLRCLTNVKVTLKIYFKNLTWKNYKANCIAEFLLTS